MRWLAVVFASMLATSVARADECPVPHGANPKLGQVEAGVRLGTIRHLLVSQADWADRWQTGWFTARTVILVGELGLGMISADPGDRTDAWITSAFAAVPPIGTLLFGLRVQRDAPRFLRRADLDTDASRCAYVALGEQLLARDAENEDENRGWVQHALQIGGSTALFLVLGLGYGHWRNAIVNGLAGIALGEAQILSQPIALVSGYRRYLAGDFDAPKLSVTVSPRVGEGGWGVAIEGRF